MRLCLTYCGQKVHIIRECSYPVQGQKHALCGAWPKQGSITCTVQISPEAFHWGSGNVRWEATALAPILCGTCRRIAQQTGSL